MASEEFIKLSVPNYKIYTSSVADGADAENPRVRTVLEQPVDRLALQAPLRPKLCIVYYLTKK